MAGSCSARCESLPPKRNLMVKVDGFHRFMSGSLSAQKKIGTIGERDTLAFCRAFQKCLRMSKSCNAQADVRQFLGGKRAPSLRR